MLRKTLEKAKYSREEESDHISHDEYQYINLIKDILEEGSMEEGRNGKALTVFGAAMHFDLTNNTIPLLTTKKVAWKTCLKELLWFIKGCTDNTKLQKQNVKIWNANASRDFLDSRGLYDLKENDLGPVYGHQWRFFNASYKDCNTNYEGQGVDQLQYIINALKNPEERTSRRFRHPKRESNNRKESGIIGIGSPSLNNKRKVKIERNPKKNGMKRIEKSVLPSP